MTPRYCVSFSSALVPMLRGAGCVPLSERATEGAPFVSWDLDSPNAAHLAWAISAGRRTLDERWWALSVPRDWPSPQPLPGVAGLFSAVWEPCECIESGGYWRSPRTLTEVYACADPTEREEADRAVRAFLSEFSFVESAP